MQLNDFLGLAKILPIDKLIDILSSSVGRLSKSYFDKKDAETKAFEIKKIAEARAEEMRIMSLAIRENFQITGGIEYKDEKLQINSPRISDKQEDSFQIDTQIKERVQNRISFQETKKQLNIENITAIAAEDLKDEPEIVNQPIDEDWITRFFNIAEEISNEEMQSLWGRILAGEIKQPKSYSLRTLELIRNLSKNEADIFMKVSNFAVKCRNENFLFKVKNSRLLEEKYDISYSDIALLTEIGLLQSGNFVNYQLYQSPKDTEHIFIANNILIITKIKANTPTVEMPIYAFSKAGNELLKLINSNPPMEYLTSIANSIKNENVDIKYANILYCVGDSITHTTPLQDFE